MNSFKFNTNPHERGGQILFFQRIPRRNGRLVSLVRIISLGSVPISSYESAVMANIYLNDLRMTITKSLDKNHTSLSLQANESRSFILHSKKCILNVLKPGPGCSKHR